MSRLPSPDTASRCVHCFPVPEATLPVPQGTFGAWATSHRLVVPPAWVALSAPAWQCCATCAHSAWRTQRYAQARRAEPFAHQVSPRLTAFGAAPRLAGAAIALPHCAHGAWPAGLTRCKASSQTTRVISGGAPFTRRRIEATHQGMPVQRHLTFAFAALDRQFEALHRACEDESLLQLDGDAQIVFLA